MAKITVVVILEGEKHGDIPPTIRETQTIVDGITYASGIMVAREIESVARSYSTLLQLES